MNFLWVGNDRCLDFVNTEAWKKGLLVDLLDEFDDLVRWLVEARAMSRETAKAVVRRWRDRREGTRTLAEARRLRRALRDLAEALAIGAPVSPAVVTRLNTLLRRPVGQSQLVRTRRGFRRAFCFTPSSPNDLLVPVAEAAVHLLCDVEPALVRKCANPKCVLLFLDRTKNHQRRWCSPASCGNRAKVAAHYRRRARTRARPRIPRGGEV